MVEIYIFDMKKYDEKQNFIKDFFFFSFFFFCSILPNVIKEWVDYQNRKGKKKIMETYFIEIP
jgi:hypothetical protein